MLHEQTPVTQQGLPFFSAHATLKSISEVLQWSGANFEVQGRGRESYIAQMEK